MIATEESKDITVNEIKVTCYSDGSVDSHGKCSQGRTMGGEHSGYRSISLAGKRTYVHSLIAEAFIGSRPRSYDVDHIDGQRSNNCPSNLRYVTRSENLRGHQSVRGNSKFRGVTAASGKHKRVRAQVGLRKEGVLTVKHLGYFDEEYDAAVARDTYCFNELNYPLEGLNFPELFVDSKDNSKQVNGMQNSEENIERIQTQIDMIRQESRLLSYRIDRMTQQRKVLMDEKRDLKVVLVDMRTSSV